MNSSSYCKNLYENYYNKNLISKPFSNEQVTISTKPRTSEENQRIVKAKNVLSSMESLKDFKTTSFFQANKTSYINDGEKFAKNGNH